MIIFKHLKTTACPDCGCTTVVSESLRTFPKGEIMTHCNGARWEQRAFLCGHIVEFSPNFYRDEKIQQCRNTEEYKKKKRKSEILRSKIKHLEQQVRKLDADNEL